MLLLSKLILFHFLIQFQVDSSSNRSKVVFKSKFFGSFCAGLFVPPNKINFDVVLANFASLLAANPYVLVVLSLLIALYIPLAIWARYADRRDRKMVRNPLSLSYGIFKVHLLLGLLIC